MLEELTFDNRKRFSFIRKTEIALQYQINQAIYSGKNHCNKKNTMQNVKPETNNKPCN